MWPVDWNRLQRMRHIIFHRLEGGHGVHPTTSRRTGGTTAGGSGFKSTNHGGLGANTPPLPAGRYDVNTAPPPPPIYLPAQAGGGHGMAIAVALAIAIPISMLIGAIVGFWVAVA